MNNEQIKTQIETIQQEIDAKYKEIKSLRANLTHKRIEDYALKNFKGDAVLLSSLFGNSNQLLVIHNMGKRCSYCTLWADNLNGITKPLADAVPFVLVSPDSPAVQEEFAASRAWKFPMLSAEGTDFIAQMGYEPKPGVFHPGVSVVVKKEDGLYQAASDGFGPGDPYCSIWHFLDLLPNGHGDWQPKFTYPG